jgi:hypothetical protein
MCDFSKSVFVSVFALVSISTTFGGCIMIDATGTAHEHGKSDEAKTVSFAPAPVQDDDGSVETAQAVYDQLYVAYSQGKIPWATVQSQERVLLARANAGKTRASLHGGAGTNGQAHAAQAAAPEVGWWCWYGQFKPVSILFIILFVILSWVAKGPFGDGMEWASGLVGGFLVALIAAGISYGVGAPAYAARLIPMGVWFSVFWAIFEISPKDENLVVKFVFAVAPLTMFILVM